MFKVQGSRLKVQSSKFKVQSSKDTIAALATPAGGAIGVIRLSGPDAIAIADRLFVPTKGSSGNPHPSLREGLIRTARYGTLRSPAGQDIDDVVATVYRAPHSYTGEDCVELSCHGSAYILRTALQALIDAGARQALPGEYTQRAYLNGKMDLSQAEAVADLVAATNRATQQMALSQLKGHFSSALALLREKLLKMTSLLELELDFSDHEELEFADRTELRQLAEDIDHRITSLADSFRTGQALKNGIPVAIVGKTNVGKSTLLNALLHDDRAIVTDIPGTTRDTLEDCIDIHGLTFRFIDTAGLRHTDDRVEQIGIERTFQAIDRATIVLWIVDGDPTAEETASMQARTKDKHLIIVHNKVDLDSDLRAKVTLGKALTPPLVGGAGGGAFISAKLGTGLSALEDFLYRTADIPEVNENSVIVTSARHYAALTAAHDALTRVLNGMADGLPSDLLAEDLRQALDALADITGGQITPQETLNNIFAHFCIGK